jgi:hypothetical protein
LKYDFCAVALTVVSRFISVLRQYRVNKPLLESPEGNAKMMFATKRALSLIAASALLCASTVANAGGPVALSDGQLDGVTAAQGGPFAGAAAAATGLGLTTFGGTQTTAITGIGSPGNDSPFGGSNATAVASAYGGGMNGPTAGSGTADATTYTQAPGNVGVTIGWNYTVYGIGTTVQTSVSSSTGLFVPGVP